MRLDLLAELRRRRLVVWCARIGEWISFFTFSRIKIEVEVPRADDAISPAGIAVEGQRKGIATAVAEDGGAISQYRVYRVDSQAIHAQPMSSSGVGKWQHCSQQSMLARPGVFSDGQRQRREASNPP
jgi:hypothetical protein